MKDFAYASYAHTRKRHQVGDPSGRKRADATNEKLREKDGRIVWNLDFDMPFWNGNAWDYQYWNITDTKVMRQLQDEKQGGAIPSKMFQDLNDTELVRFENDCWNAGVYKKENFPVKWNIHEKPSEGLFRNTTV